MILGSEVVLPYLIWAHDMPLVLAKYLVLLVTPITQALGQKWHEHWKIEQTGLSDFSGSIYIYCDVLLHSWWKIICLYLSRIFELTDSFRNLTIVLALTGPSGPPALAPAPRDWILAYLATFNDPMDQSHTLDLIMKAPRASSLRTIRLLKKDVEIWNIHHPVTKMGQ